jgi:hypothetical protein
MKDELETSLQVLEEATAAGKRPAEPADAEFAPLREAWLALGEILDAAQPNDTAFLSRVVERKSEINMATVRRRWHGSLMAALVAASLLVAVATLWLAGFGNRPSGGAGPQQMANANQQVAPQSNAMVKNENAADTPQWDDSFDDKLEDVRCEMLCVQGNQAFRTDAFGQAQYQLEQLRDTIQADSL